MARWEASCRSPKFGARWHLRDELKGHERLHTPAGGNVEMATYTNAIGDALMMAHWEDPDFDPAERAFYYVRVIEIPTPRWPAYDAARFAVEMPSEIQLTIQDRAYTSPIWYTPG